MKSLFALSAVLAVVASVPFGSEDRWSNFKFAHARDYDSPHEELRRQQIFHQNLKKIEEHNARYAAGEVSWYMAVNKFADMTPEEFVEYQNRSVLPSRDQESQARELFKPTGLKDYPERLDYRKDFNPVREQVACGSCYAITVSEVIEASYFQKHSQRVELSPQNLVDCSTVEPYNNGGCVGGYLAATVQYVEDHGLMLEKDYPYTDKQGECKYDSSKVAPVKVTSYVEVQNDNDHLKAALVEQGPLAVGVDAKEWQFYDGGIFHPVTPYVTPTHAVALVGYGVTDMTQKEFWILRNSYGSYWGEDGHMRIARNLVAPYHIGLGTVDEDTITPVFPVVA